MAQKRNISSWKQKKQYTILSPDAFDRQEVGLTVADDPEKLVGRVVDISLSDLSGDRGKQHLKLFFEITGNEEDRALTRIKRYTTSVGYLKSRVRKGNTKLDYQHDVKTSDGSTATIKTIILTRGRVPQQVKADLRDTINKLLKMQTKLGGDELVQHALFGKMGTEIYQKIKSIHPIARVEVWQISLS